VGVAVAFGLAGSALIQGSVLALSLAANPDAYSVRHDRVLTVAAPGVLGNDVILLGTSTAVRDSLPAHGSLAFQSNGAFSYTPNAGYVGTDTFRYHAHDGLLNTGSTTVTITITNAAPVAVADSYTATTGVTKAVAAPGVLANDTDADGDPLTAQLVDGGGNGSIDLNADGSFTYTSGGSFSGDRTFTYRVWDGFTWSATATVTITVSPAATPKPTPAPTAPPTPAPTPTAAPSPKPIPVPTPRPVPSLPIPSLPLPSLPIPTRPIATPSPSDAARPTPSSTSPTSAPGAAGPILPPPGGGTGGGGTSAGNAGPGLGFTVEDGFGAFDDFDPVAFGGFDWAVPSFVLSVPGLLLLLALAAQGGVGVLSLPFVRRWLGSFGLRRRRGQEAQPG